VNYVSESCTSNPNVSESDLVDLLEDIMDEEFDTVCDDGSTKEISLVLVKYLRMLQQGKIEDIKQELNNLGPCQIWIRPGHRINYIKSPDSDSSSESDEEMDVPSENQVTGPSTSGSTIPMEEEDMAEVDPGWTVVKTKKRK
jgi:pre-rRNA-processing protein TSR2